VQPKVKVLACGEEGRGAMAEVEDIVVIVKRKLPKGGGAVKSRGERIKRMVLEATHKF